MSEPKLPMRVRKIIDRCRHGEVLCKTYRNKESGNTEVLFSFHPSGKRAGPASSQEAIASGLLVPQNDGLFEAGDSQTWRAA